MGSCNMVGVLFGALQGETWRKFSNISNDGNM
jgi:hypothetical protein